MQNVRTYVLFPSCRALTYETRQFRECGRLERDRDFRVRETLTTLVTIKTSDNFDKCDVLYYATQFSAVKTKRKKTRNDKEIWK